MIISACGWLWKRKFILLSGGLVLCLITILLTCRNSSSVLVSYVFPGAENGIYPDGQRLLRDDLIASARVEEALSNMRENGWYENVSQSDIIENLTVKEYLTNPVQDKVEQLLAEGREYTYYNNEYIVSYVQPGGVFAEDRSEEYLNALILCVCKAFINEHTDGAVFSELCRYIQAGDADYDELYNVYTVNAELCAGYLARLRDEDSTFVSASTGMSFDDLETAYQSLADVQIARLRKFVVAEKVCKSLDETVNTYTVDIENYELTGAKKADEYEIAKAAMLDYDHTFNDNIIIVSANEENGLYQARPKTAYDTVAQRSLNAGVEAEVAKNAAADARRLITEYTASMGGSGIDEKLATADALAADVEKEYARLSQLSANTIADYITYKNDNYIKTIIIKDDGFSLDKIALWAAYFAGGVALTALACLLMHHGRTKMRSRTEGSR